MRSMVTAALIFGCAFGGALLGIFVRGRLPSHHQDGDTRDTVKLIMGLVATMAALVLSLLISSAHSLYETQNTEIQQLGVHLSQLDRILVHFGHDAAPARALLRRVLAADIERTWPADGVERTTSAPSGERTDAEQLFEAIANLSPATNLDRLGQSRALQLLADSGETRRLMSQQTHASLSWVFVAVLVFWLTLLFFGFGLFALFNRTVVVALLAGALSVAAASFLILEMNHPYRGWMQLSSAPLRDALGQMDE
jgi:hypothetical protein